MLIGRQRSLTNICANSAILWRMVQNLLCAKVCAFFLEHLVCCNITNIFLVGCSELTVSIALWVARHHDFEPISGFIVCHQCCDRQVLPTWCRAEPWQVVTLIAGSKRRSLLMVGDDNEMFMTRSLYIVPKTKVQHLIVRSDKSVAYVTNNKRLCSTFCTVTANY